ncbi:hypothetical protein A2U01_0008613, partial [Trifolium medium]|nr:hypothetical protein [Trifolium medium]
MRFLSWNCQGCGNPKTGRALKKLIAKHQPDVIFLMETKKLSTDPSFLNTFSDDYSFKIVDCSTTGGVACHWHLWIVKEAWQWHTSNLQTKLEATLTRLHQWGQKKFGIIPKKIKQAEDDLQHLTEQNQNGELMAVVKSKEKEIDELLQCEEMWWNQRSRVLWLKHGDKNTRFFHQKASQRKRKNKIEAITDRHGGIHTDHGDIEETLISHFKDLFTSQDTWHIPDTIEVVKNSITKDMYNHLNATFTREEVQTAIKDMKGLAAPGPYGL